MAEATFAIPGDLDTPTGGYAYDRRLLALLPARGWTVAPLMLPAAFPEPDDAALTQTETLLRGVPAGQPILVDSLAFGALPADMLDRLHRRFAALVHHPLALETGLAPARAAALRTSERAALGHAAAVIATGATTAETLVADYAVPPELLTLAEPGTNPAPRATGSAVPRLLAVGALIPRKDYPLLVAALAQLRDLAWTCHVVGSERRDPACAALVRHTIAAAGLEHRVVLRGVLDAPSLATEWAAADLFVTTSAYEGYGMAAAEALAHGLPVVASACDGLVRRVPAAAAAVVPAGDAAALAGALRALLASPASRRAMAGAAWVYGQTLPSWDDTAARVAAVLERIAEPLVPAHGSGAR